MQIFESEFAEAEALPWLLDALSKEVNTDPKRPENVAKGIPSLNFVRAIIVSKLSSHTNRLVDSRNTAMIVANYGQLGDITAATTIGSFHRDIHANAPDIPKIKTLTCPYTVNGRVTNLLDAIIEARPAGTLLCDISKVRHYPAVGHDPLDKSVLIPWQGRYIDMRPVTPSYLPVAMKQAFMDVAARLINKALDELRENMKANKPIRWPVLGLKARSRRMSKAQNYSFFMSAIGGQVFQSIFLPPPLSRPDAAVQRRSAMEWSEHGFNINLFRPILKSVANDSGLILKVARQKHRHKDGLESIKDMESIDNMKTREAFNEFGRHVGMVLREAIEAVPLEKGSPADDERSRLLEDHENKALSTHAWNLIGKSLPENYRLVDRAGDKGFDLFQKGFEVGFWFAPAQSDEKKSKTMSARSDRPTSHASRGSRFMVIRMSVDAHDAGSAAPTLGIPAPTAMFGFLHRVVEREAGLSMLRFMPVILECRLQDQLAQRHGIKIKINEDAKKRIKDQGGDADPALSVDGLVIYADDMPASLTGKATPVQVETRDKAIAPPFQYEVKASTTLILVVELESFVDEGAANDVIKNIESAIRKARLAGGEIRRASVNLHEAAPKIKRGFVLVRQRLGENDNPLNDLVRNIAFVDREYQGDYPMGLLACGYEGIQPAQSISRKGETYPAQHAETIYKGFRFSGVHHPEPAWFEIDVRQRGDLFDVQFCQ